MLIEKIQLIEFNEMQEKARLQRNFKGARQATLIAILDHFVASKWEAAIALVQTLSRDEFEYLHPVVLDVLRDIASVIEDQAKAAKKPPKTLPFDRLVDFRGIPVSPARVDYPKFSKLA